MGEDDEDLGEDNGELRLLVPRLDPTVRAEDVAAIRGMREDDAIELLREYGIAGPWESGPGTEGAVSWWRPWLLRPGWGTIDYGREAVRIAATPEGTLFWDTYNDCDASGRPLPEVQAHCDRRSGHFAVLPAGGA